MKEFVKPVYACEYCGEEYGTKPECEKCETECLEKKNAKAKLSEVVAAEEKAKDLRKRYNESYVFKSASKEDCVSSTVESGVKSVSWGMITEDGKEKYFRNGKEVSSDEVPKGMFDCWGVFSGFFDSLMPSWLS